MVKLTKRDLAIIGGLAGVADFLAEGRLSAPLSRALKRAAIAAGKRAIFTAPAAARVSAATLPRIGMTALKVGKTIALRHPILTAGAIAYYTIKNRDEIEDIIREGYEVVSDVELPGAQRRRDFAADPIGFVQDVRSEMTPGVGPGGFFRPLPGRIPESFRQKKPKRRKSTYNTAVSNTAKKAF